MNVSDFNNKRVTLDMCTDGTFSIQSITYIGRSVTYAVVNCKGKIIKHRFNLDEIVEEYNKLSKQESTLLI